MKFIISEKQEYEYLREKKWEWRKNTKGNVECPGIWMVCGNRKKLSLILAQPAISAKQSSGTKTGRVGGTDSGVSTLRFSRKFFPCD
jgi:hypothetical protein